jgi:hypothetical protein
MEEISQSAALAVNEAFPDVAPTPTPDPTPIPPTPVAENTIPEAQVTTEAKETPADTDEDLDKQLDEIKPKSPQQEKGFATLKGLVKAERASRREIEKKAKEFETRIQELENREILTPEIKTELEELSTYRRAEDPSKDPEIQQKFISQLEAKNTQAINILKTNELRDPVIELIQKAGGIGVISNSNEIVPALLGGELTWSEWLSDKILPKLPLADRKRMERLVADTADLSDQMDAAVQDAKTHATERAQERAKQMGESYAQGAQEAIKSLGIFGQKWEYPDNATDYQKSTVDKHNDRFDKVSALYQEFEGGMKDPKNIGRLVVTAAQSAYLMEANKDLVDQVEKLQKDYKELQDRHEKVKGSGAATRQSNAPPPGTEVQSDKNLTARQAVEEFLK